MELGKAYLIHGGDWHTFVGRVVAHVGALTYRMESVSKIADTGNGDVWHDLADGKGRARCTYRHSKGPCIVPLTIIAFEWQGKTPQEEGLPG